MAEDRDALVAAIQGLTYWDASESYDFIKELEAAGWVITKRDEAEQLDRIREMLGLQGSDEDVPEALGEYLLYLERQ